LSHYLLEMIRVVDHASGERAFHIFCRCRDCVGVCAFCADLCVCICACVTHFILFLPHIFFLFFADQLCAAATSSAKRNELHYTHAHTRTLTQTHTLSLSSL
jgi:hypothetical protein